MLRGATRERQCRGCGLTSPPHRLQPPLPSPSQHTATRMAARSLQLCDSGASFTITINQKSRMTAPCLQSQVSYSVHRNQGAGGGGTGKPLDRSSETDSGTSFSPPHPPPLVPFQPPGLRGAPSRLRVRVLAAAAAAEVVAAKGCSENWLPRALLQAAAAPGAPGALGAATALATAEHEARGAAAVRRGQRPSGRSRSKGWNRVSSSRSAPPLWGR